MVVFTEEDHRYTNPETGEDYISATTLLGKYKPVFQKDKYSKRVAEREGVEQETILNHWKNLTSIACDRGSGIHEAVENYIKDGNWDDNYDEILLTFQDLFERVGSNNEIRSEVILWNDDYKIAGMTDILIEEDKYFRIWDIKTNKRIRTTNTFREDKFLKEPIDFLPNCEYSVYSLQLSLYAYLYELLSGKKCIELKIIHIKPINKFLPNEDKKVEIYNSPYLKTDIHNIIEHYVKTRTTE